MTDETMPETAESAAPVETTDTPESAPVEIADDAGQPAQDKPQEDKVPESVQKRIDRAIWRQRQAERRTDELLQYVTQLQGQKPDPEPTVPQGRPTRAQFEFNDEKYEEALLEYATRQAEAAAERKLSQWQAQQVEQAQIRSYETRVAEFAKAAPDYEEVVSDPSLPFTSAMAKVIRSTEEGPKVAYHLAQHPEELAQIARLPPELQTYELARVASKLSQPPPVAAPARPVVSQAPPPPPKIEASEAPVETDPDKMPIEDWIKWRNKSLRAAHARSKR